VIAEIADRVAVMYAGQIVEHAEVKELFANPQHPYTRALLETLPRMGEARAARLPSIDGQPPNLDHAPVHCEFAPRCKHAFARCLKENPKRFEVNPAHDVACFLAQSGGSSDA
jgi:peptide/nickel transport system ATP-binding protein/oligopeptide transport system ATP-binding protein